MMYLIRLIAGIRRCALPLRRSPGQPKLMLLAGSIQLITICLPAAYKNLWDVQKHILLQYGMPGTRPNYALRTLRILQEAAG